MRWKPHVTVAGLIAESERFLIVEEEIINDNIVLNQPAGHLDPGESLLDAVCREVLEETAYEFTPQGLVGIYLFAGRYAQVTYLRFCFHGQAGAYHPEQPLDDGILRTLWLSQAELKANHERLRTPVVLQCVTDFLQGRSWPLEILQHDAALVHLTASATRIIQEE